MLKFDQQTLKYSSMPVEGWWCLITENVPGSPLKYSSDL